MSDSNICPPTEHDFERGGDADGDWEAWLFCKRCGSVGMVPTDAAKPATIYPPEYKPLPTHE